MTQDEAAAVNIGIAGLSGRMGHLLAQEVAVAGACLVGGINRSGDNAPAGVALLADIAALAGAADVVIEFAHPGTVIAHAAAIAAAGRAWVLGTTGLSAADEAAVAAAARRVPVVYAANFSPGVTLVLALAEKLAAALPACEYDAEIVEMHHRQKVDAPSGTAIGIGRAVAAGRGVALEDVRDGARDGRVGPRRPGAIGFAALRGGQVVGEHTLLFASATEHISLNHRAFDRRVFASGAVRAALWACGRPPGLYSMMDVLGMA